MQPKDETVRDLEVQALALMEEALALLDRAGTQPLIAAHLDLPTATLAEHLGAARRGESSVFDA